MSPSPVFVKTAAIGAIVLVLALALMRIGHLVTERESRFRQAEDSVAQSLAGRQAVLGPTLLSHCVEAWDKATGEGKDRTTAGEKREFTLMATPASLDVQGSATMEPRYRGLFKVNTYVARATLKARWESTSALQHHGTNSG